MSNYDIPNFFIVGAPKCGTTALFTYLIQHPDVLDPGRKEFNYFCDDLTFRNSSGLFSYSGLNDYLSFFAAAKNESRIGEASVWYLYSLSAAQKIYSLNPAAKIITMIRNPIDLVYSLYFQLRKTGDEDIGDFASALAAETDRRQGNLIPRTDQASAPVEALYYTDVAMLSKQIDRFQTLFGREQIHIVLYDDLQKKTTETYRAVLRFLEISQDHAPALDTVNSNRLIRNTALWRLLKFGSPRVRRTWRTVVPSSLRRRTLRTLNNLNTVEGRRPPMDSATRGQLREVFAADVKRLGGMLGRDLMPWITTAHGSLSDDSTDAV